MPRGLILWDIPRQYPNSMDRYADRLGTNLRSLIEGTEWSFHDLILHCSGLPWDNLGALDSRFKHIQELTTRFLIYPIKAFANSADIYHVIDHGYGHLAYVLGNRNLVITCNDLMTLRLAEGNIPEATISRSSELKFRSIVSGLRFANAIIAISYSTKKDLIKFLEIPDNKIHVIYMGVDSQFAPVHNINETISFKQQLGVPINSKIILHVSGITAYKNIEGVLRILAIVVNDLGIKACLLRVGGLLDNKHKQLARQLGIDSSIHEAGHLTDQELIKAYNLADVLLFPSWWEGFGLPILEAMACGTPVVASNRASLPEVVGDAGVLFDPDDYEGMAKAIRHILKHSDWRNALIAKGFAQAAKFRWEKTAVETLKIYEKVLIGSDSNGRRKQ